jgi:putative transposase
VYEQTKRQETLKAVLDYFYQDNTRSGSHSRYNLKYHLVWITKYRRSFLTGNLAVRLKHILADIAYEYGFKIIVHEVMPDHVHMLIEARPTDTPMRIVQILKSKSSRKIREEFPDIIQQYIWKEGTFWAAGYYIASIADGITTEVIQEYIRNQKTDATPHILFRSEINNLDED